MTKLRKHENNTTVAIEIIKSFYVPEKEIWKMKVMWWNISRTNPPYCMNITQNITVSKEDMKKWRPYES